MKINEKDLWIVSHLRRNARMKLTDMSRMTKLPVSTLFDKIKTYEGSIVKKYTALAKFERFGYQAKALIILATSKENRQKLHELLEKNRNVNSLYKINNGWDYMTEVILPGVKEVEEFLEGIEEQVRLKNKKVFYIIEEIKKEEFLANPKAVQMLGGIR